jgi:hypothetical protein
MTINVETDHPHGVAHVALFTCQPGLAAGTGLATGFYQSIGATRQTARTFHQ